MQEDMVHTNLDAINNFESTMVVNLSHIACMYPTFAVHSFLGCLLVYVQSRSCQFVCLQSREKNTNPYSKQRSNAVHAHKFLPSGSADHHWCNPLKEHQLV